jgi:hypothetical protein
MCCKNHNRQYACGHRRQGPIRSLVARALAKPILSVGSQYQPGARYADQSLAPQTSGLITRDERSMAEKSFPIDPFRDQFAPPPAYNSMANVREKEPLMGVIERELTPEDRVRTGVEYVNAYLARSRSNSPARDSQGKGESQGNGRPTSLSRAPSETLHLAVLNAPRALVPEPVGSRWAAKLARKEERRERRGERC